MLANIDAYEFKSNVSTINAFKSAVVQSMAYGSAGLSVLPLSAINITSVSNIATAVYAASFHYLKLTISRRSLQSASSGINIVYSVVFIAENLGFADGETAYTTLTTNLVNAVEQKYFADILKNSSIPVLEVAVPEVPVFSDLTITIEKSPSPTFMPSLTPTVVVTGIAETGLAPPAWLYANWSLAGKVVLPIGCVLFALIIGFVGYRVHQWRLFEREKGNGPLTGRRNRRDDAVIMFDK